MATKPSNLAEWGTGAAPIVEPTLPQKQAGWTPAFKPPAQWFNWWWNLVHLWIVWLDAFESEAHTWTALQTFDGRLTASSSTGSPAILATNTRASLSAPAISADSSTSTAGIAIDGLGGFIGVNGETASAIAGGAGVRGVSTNAATAGLLGVTTAVGGMAAYLDGGAVAGVTLLAGLATGANSKGIDVLAVEWGVRGDASDNTIGVGVIGRGGIAGVRGTGGTGVNGKGVDGIGTGAGAGVSGVGGAVSGNGVDGTGGAPNGNGVVGIGAGTGNGVVGVGGPTNAAGGDFARGDFNDAKPAIVCRGAIALIAAADVAGATAIAQELHRKQVIRAWALVTLNGTAAPTVVDRMGMSTVIQQTAGAGIVTFTMAQAMSGTGYGVLREVDANISNARVARASITSTTVFAVEVYDPSAPTAVLTAASTNGYTLFVAVLGAQP